MEHYALQLAVIQFALQAKHEGRFRLACELIVSEERKLRSTVDLILYNTHSPDEVQQLFRDVQSPGWNSPEVEAAFRNTLGDSGHEEVLQSLRTSIRTLYALELSLFRLSSSSRGINPDDGLRRQFQWVLRMRKAAKEIERIEKQMEELRQRNQAFDTYVPASAISRSIQARRTIDDAASFIFGIEALTRQALEAMSPNLPDISSLAVEEDAMSMMTEGDVPIPHEPEQGEEGVKLRYLDVKIQSDQDGSASQSRAGRLPEKALLDSGATHNMISVALARRLGLGMPNDPEIKEVRTLVPSDKRLKAWKASVILRWVDKDGKHYIKIDVYVHEEMNLGKNLILGQGFMSNHQEAWHASTQVPESDMQLNATFLGWLRPEDKKKQAERLVEIEKRNQARHEAERSKKQEAKSKQGSPDASEAGTSTRSDPGQSNTSSG